ncbi:hypothetical protein H4S00_001088 [Coemansia sp. D1744]|nr:hypothetical protein H4S00_001088 [Coemansia sp. D1744]
MMLARRSNPRVNKSWRMGMNMQMTLWTTEENQVFFSNLVRNIVITKTSGLKLTRGILDMSALELIMKGLASDSYNWLVMEELEADYPERSWLEMVWQLADLHNKLDRHSMFEINYKILRAIENIILPLNAIFLGQVMPNTHYVAKNGTYHPLTNAIIQYGDYCRAGTLESNPKEFHFIDYFMQAMVSQHGVRMGTFLQICRESLSQVAKTPLAEEDELVVAMEHLSLEP